MCVICSVSIKIIRSSYLITSYNSWYGFSKKLVNSKVINNDHFSAIKIIRSSYLITSDNSWYRNSKEVGYKQSHICIICSVSINIIRSRYLITSANT